jgi:hypothetical protein
MSLEDLKKHKAKAGSPAPLEKPDLTKVAPLKLKKKHLKYVMNYYDPNSDTFGNSYQSALNAGFSNLYSQQLASPARQTQWVLEARKRMTHFSADHIYEALQDVAKSGQPRDKLKALELMGKSKGMFIDRSQQDVHVTFTNDMPRPANETVVAEVIDITPESTDAPN